MWQRRSGVGSSRRLTGGSRRRRRNFDGTWSFSGDLPGVEFMPEASYGRCSRWLTCLTIDPAAFGAGREDVRVALESENIEARPVWKPMHLQPVFTGCRVIGGSVSAKLFETGLCLPSGSNLTQQDVERTAGIICECLGSRGARFKG